MPTLQTFVIGLVIVVAVVGLFVYAARTWRRGGGSGSSSTGTGSGRGGGGGSGDIKA